MAAVLIVLSRTFLPVKLCLILVSVLFVMALLINLQTRLTVFLVPTMTVELAIFQVFVLLATHLPIESWITVLADAFQSMATTMMEPVSMLKLVLFHV